MHFTIEQFTPLIGATFTVQTSQGPVALRLAEATECPRRGLPERFRTPLSLIFDGPDGIVLGQDNYRVGHPEFGEHVFCIVPVLSGDGRPQYQALFT